MNKEHIEKIRMFAKYIIDAYIPVEVVTYETELPSGAVFIEFDNGICIDVDLKVIRDEQKL